MAEIKKKQPLLTLFFKKKATTHFYFLKEQSPFNRVRIDRCTIQRRVQTALP